LGKIQAQTNDTTLTKLVNISSDSFPYIEQSYLYLQIRAGGLLGGFQHIDGDSVNIAIGMPFETSLRYYPKFNNSTYFDLSLAYNFFILNNHILTPIMGGSLGYGILAKRYNSNIQVIKIGYYHGFTGEHTELSSYKDILSLGYVFETSSIPISLEFFAPFGNKEFDLISTLFLIGVRIPIMTIDFSSKQKGYK